MTLSDIIEQQIKNKGPLSFHDFMEKALYYPGLGYYTSEKDRIGKTGDFYTSSSLTPAFGAMVARQIQQMWEICGDPDFTIIEYGAGTGLLCHDILNYFHHHTGLSGQLNHCIIEKSPVMIARQKDLLKDRVRWLDSAADLGVVTGCVLSNELLDNFAVHRVVADEELKEIFIDYEEGYTEITRPATDDIKKYFEELGIALPAGFRTEVNLEAVGWLAEAAACLRKGFLMTIDYGALSGDLYDHRRKDGTLVCFHKHTVNDQFYDNIGEQDITAHVNFSALIHFGKKVGFEYGGYSDQAQFLLSLGFKEWLRKSLSNSTDIMAMAKKESFLTNQLLIEMGSKFKVLVLRKGLPEHSLLGFQYA